MHIVINPIEEIETKYKNGDFFTGFALAVTYFEYQANLILSMFFQGRISRKALERWSLALKIRLIFGLNLIEEKEVFHKIHDIIEMRNRLIHPTEQEDKEERKGDTILRFRLNEEEKSLLLGFKECYSELVQTDFKVFKKRLGNGEPKSL